jgi:hypothetical protein
VQVASWTLSVANHIHQNTASPIQLRVADRNFMEFEALISEREDKLPSFSSDISRIWNSTLFPLDIYPRQVREGLTAGDL